ncbi:MAG: hypothetical protein GEEBNDBF_01038 [bacterium]|nr:hypothetical protein [bacterium]
MRQFEGGGVVPVVRIVGAMMLSHMDQRQGQQPGAEESESRGDTATASRKSGLLPPSDWLEPGEHDGGSKSHKCLSVPEGRIETIERNFPDASGTHQLEAPPQKDKDGSAVAHGPVQEREKE